LTAQLLHSFKVIKLRDGLTILRDGIMRSTFGETRRITISNPLQALEEQYQSLEGSHGIMSSKFDVAQEITIFSALSDSLRSQTLGGQGAACGLIA